MSDPQPYFTYQRRIPFAETDAAGIAHFSQFTRWVEEAECAFWRAHEIPIPILADGVLTGFPRVSFNIRYRRPVHFDDVLEIAIRPTVAASSAVEWTFRIRRGAELCASGSMTVVFAEGNPLRGELKSRPMTPQMLAVLTA
jgi:YbgC/YbaW family acyl-CoA thioester hydrolase